MEEGQVDQAEGVAVASSDPLNSIMQTVKGHKVLATPAVRRLAQENKVIHKLSICILEMFRDVILWIAVFLE